MVVVVVVYVVTYSVSRPHRMHTVQKCGQMLVTVSLGHKREPYKTVEPIVMPFGMGMGTYGPMNHLFGGSVITGGKGTFQAVILEHTQTCSRSIFLT